MKRRTFIQAGIAGTALYASPALFANRQEKYTQALSSASNTTVINAGVGGNNTIDLLERFEKDCLQHQPDLVIFMAGTNDMNSKKFVALPAFEKNMQQLISRMKKIKSSIALMNLLPVYEPYLFTRHERSFYEPEGHHGRLLQMNESIRKLADMNKTALVDLYHVFSRVGNIGTAASSLIKNEANSQTTDGLHPTADGYRVMAVAVHAQLVCRQLENKKKIVCFGDSITKGDGIDGGENYPSYLQKLL